MVYASLEGAGERQKSDGSACKPVANRYPPTRWEKSRRVRVSSNTIQGPDGIESNHDRIAAASCDSCGCPKCARSQQQDTISRLAFQLAIYRDAQSQSLRESMSCDVSAGWFDCRRVAFRAGQYVFFDENCVLLANLLSMVEDSICKSDEPT